MAKKEDSAVQRELEAKKALGFSPAFAAAAAYEGVPLATRHILSDAPHGLMNLLRSGKEIPEGIVPGTKLQDIAEFTRKEVKAIQRFAEESGVKLPIVAGHSPEYKAMKTGYFADPDLPTVKLRQAARKLVGKEPLPVHGKHIGLSTTSLPTAFHEIGHATPIKGSHRARRILQDIGSLMGTGGKAGNLARLAIAGNVLAPPTEESHGARQFAYDHAPVLAAATFAPALAEELRASGKALSGMRRQGLGTFKAIKELAPMFGTYAGAAAAPVIATLLAKKLVQALHDKAEGEEKKAAASEVKAPGVLRNSASSAWHIGGRTPPKPKSIKPDSKLDATARGRSQAKPPSNRAYHKDLLASLYNPQRGFRIAKPG